MKFYTLSIFAFSLLSISAQAQDNSVITNKGDKVSVDNLKTEPWRIVGTADKSTKNNENIYQNAQVGIGDFTTSGKIGAKLDVDGDVRVRTVKDVHSTKNTDVPAWGIKALNDRMGTTWGNPVVRTADGNLNVIYSMIETRVNIVAKNGGGGFDIITLPNMNIQNPAYADINGGFVLEGFYWDGCQASSNSKGLMKIYIYNNEIVRVTLNDGAVGSAYTDPANSAIKGWELGTSCSYSNRLVIDSGVLKRVDGGGSFTFNGIIKGYGVFTQ